MPLAQGIEATCQAFVQLAENQRISAASIALTAQLISSTQPTLPAKQ
jgi:hypothetical protein